MKEAINTTLEMFLCMIIGAALGAYITYSHMRDKEETPNGSNVPDEFLVTESDVDSSEFFATVYTCEDVEKFKINYLLHTHSFLETKNTQDNLS